MPMILVQRRAIDWERKMTLLAEVSKLASELREAQYHMEIIVPFVHGLDPAEKDRLHHAAHRNPLWPGLGNSVSRGLLSLLAPMFVNQMGMVSDRRRTAAGLLEAAVAWLYEKGPEHPYYTVYLDLCQIGSRMQDLSVDCYEFIKYNRELTYDKLERYIQQIDILGQSMEEV